jgi:PTH1 family peptidyl-tRNA hydrolase
MEKPFGNISLKEGGSSKGHNGLKSIMGVYGPDFWRLRFGIGRPETKEEVPDYVLARFKESKELVDTEIRKAVELISA